MQIAVRSVRLSLIAGINLLVLSACNWVDSTGIQSEPTSPLSSNAISGLRNAQPLILQEELAVTTALVGQGASLRNWTWSPDDSDIRNSCTGIDGFDAQLAVTTLNEACANTEECTIAFDENISDNTTQFTIRLPRLSAPVALGYSLSTDTEDGGLLTRQQPICGISINEAPLAVDDNFIVLRDERRLVAANDPDNLLANDSDDVDIRNQTLTINPIPVQSPRYAAEFSLGTDGSFLYRAIDNAPTTNERYIDDSFVYTVTDGLHRVDATAVVRIVNGNQAPRRRQRIPDLDLIISNDQYQDVQHIDLSSYFHDPDGDPLHFSIRDDLLPQSRNISITADGLLIARPGLQDLGRWRLTVVVSDGIDDGSDVFVLEVLPPDANNLPPTALDIHNRIVQNSFIYDVSIYFSDPDDDELSFSATGLPEGVQISDKGIIRGQASSDNLGFSFVQVTANDNRGGTATDGFALIIN